jgi:SAM-dependent methyltransferase
MYEGYDQVILLDYSRSQLEYARQRFGDDRFIYVVADIYKFPLATNAVDTAVMVRVLHHIADVPLALQQVKRVVCGQGAFILEFANKRHLKNIAKYMIGRGINPFDRCPYEFADLHYDFHPAWVARQLREAGFEVERRLSVSNLRSAFLKRIFSTSSLVKMEAVLQRVAAPLALGPSIFVRAAVNTEEGEELVTREHLFRCPTCGHEPLLNEDKCLRCSACQATWPVENGIYIFK